MKKNLSMILCSLLLTVIPATAQFDEKNEDAIYLKVQKIYTLNPDGSSRLDYSHRVKLLTYQTVNRGLGETFIVYNPRYQSLFVEKSVTTMANGKMVDSPANAFNDVLPAAVNNAPDFAYLREKVITHTGLERNCTVELCYHLDNQAEFQPWLWGEEVFALRYPVVSMNVIVRVPQGTNLAYEFFNAEVQPAVQDESGFTCYSWTLQNLPAQIAEDYHQEFGEFMPRLVFSTCPSWEALRQSLSKDLTAKLLLDDQSQKALTKNCTAVDTFGRMLQLRNTVADEIGTITLQPAWLGYRFDAAQRTVTRNYGQEIEKALVFIVLARSIDQRADLIWMSRFRQFAEKVPALIQFNRAVVAVYSSDDEALLMSLTGEQNRRIEDESAGLFLFSLNENLPPYRLEKKQADVLKVEAQLQVDKSCQVSGAVMITASGYVSPYLQLQNAEGQTAFVRRMINQIFGGGEIEKVMVQRLDQTGVQVILQYKSDGLFKKIGDKDWYEFAGVKSTFDDWRFSPYLTHRLTPILFPHELNEEIKIEWTADNSLVWSGSQFFRGIDLQTKNDQVKYILQNKAGNFQLETSPHKNKLTYIRKVQLADNRFSPELYSDLKVLLSSLQVSNGRIFYLASK